MELDNASVKILRCFKKQKSLSMEQLIIFTPYEFDDLQERVNALLERQLIEIDHSEKDPILTYKIKTDGKFYLENHLKKGILAWTPLVLSSIAIIISIIALLK